MNAEQISEFVRFIGPIGDFKPCARFSCGDVLVNTKDCSYTSQRINPWLNIFWENHRPWYAPWKKCVGFSVYCPSILGLYGGKKSIAAVLDRVYVVANMKDVFGTFDSLLYRQAQGLTVQLPL